jgi:hypothetical protein
MGTILCYTIILANVYNILAFYNPKGSLSCSQDSVTAQYIHPHESGQHNMYIYSIVYLVLQVPT